MTLTSNVTTEAAVCGDEDLMRQLILNLLDNALKYGSEGGTVEISLCSGPGSHCVIVRDSGPGFRPMWRRTFSIASTGEMVRAHAIPRRRRACTMMRTGSEPAWGSRSRGGWRKHTEGRSCSRTRLSRAASSF